jgi:hypothetical protein
MSAGDGRREDDHPRSNPRKQGNSGYAGAQEDRPGAPRPDPEGSNVLLAYVKEPCEAAHLLPLFAWWEPTVIAAFYKGRPVSGGGSHSIRLIRWIDPLKNDYNFKCPERQKRHKLI